MCVFHNLRDTYLKMKGYILVHIKIYGGNINTYTMYTLCMYYEFFKNNETLQILQNDNFQLKSKMLIKCDSHHFNEKQYVPYSKNIAYIINTYKNLRRKTLHTYTFYAITLHYFFLKITKIPDFVKYQILINIVNFHEMCGHHLVKNVVHTPEKHEV